jgi:hypothetical protein
MSYQTTTQQDIELHVTLLDSFNSNTNRILVHSWDLIHHPNCDLLVSNYVHKLGLVKFRSSALVGKLQVFELDFQDNSSYSFYYTLKNKYNSLRQPNLFGYTRTLNTLSTLYVHVNVCTTTSEYQQQENELFVRVITATLLHLITHNTQQFIQ